MSMIPDILEFNKKFVAEKKYERYVTDKFPTKKLVILTCMDARLSELLPRALNLRNGDAKIIKNAGAIITQPFGSAMRSILVAIYEMQASEVMVIGHYGCGMTNLDTESIVGKFKDVGGVPQLAIDTLENAGIRMERFLQGFSDPKEGVLHSVRMVRKHPLVPRHVPVHGFLINPETGELDVVVQAYQPLRDIK